ncbi:MAG: cell envelope integrity protein CreD [Rickettsiales bacterium]|jgi:inner membrane protein|nr:cell envelope integrity protein CreD [Rickettsiales bacterium]
MNGKINTRITLKALAIGALALIMLIPLLFVSGVIDGRLNYRDEAAKKITNAWGGPLLVAAPVLNIPYKVQITDDRTKAVSYETRWLKVAPKEALSAADIKTQTRYIGIFRVPVYTADISIKGKFDIAGAIKGKENLSVSGAFITLELNDLKGMGVESPVLKWNGKAHEFEPMTNGKTLSAGVPTQRDLDSGSWDMNSSKGFYRNREISADLKALSTAVNAKAASADFEISFNIKGSRSISFAPIAGKHTIAVKSDWTNPSFYGSFLPDEKNVDGAGFSARWDIGNLASGIPTTDLSKADLSGVIITSAFLVPVDNYRSAERALKYGILFIILTFLACFIFEIASGRPIHPFQYLLVGFAMAIFYILLVSLSEFMAFSLAYIIAALATTGLITAYIKTAVVKNLDRRSAGIVFGAFAALYGYLYILLLLQDMALIFGAIGLFIGLAAAMYATKNIKWYEAIQAPAKKK